MLIYKYSSLLKMLRINTLMQVELQIYNLYIEAIRLPKNRII